MQARNSTDKQGTSRKTTKATKGSKSSNRGSKTSKATFTETGRRAQIVAAAIDVIAETGYHQASFAKIAERAGLSSTGMISYHFDGRDDLMREVVAEVMRVAEAYVRPRIEAHESAPARLRASIESNLDLLAEYPNHLPAIVEVLTNLRGGDPGMDSFLDKTEADLALQVERIREAQRAGEFCDFDPWVMVRAIRAAVDDVVRRATLEPDFDARRAGRELADLFDRATRNRNTT
ncbi:TetR/AcrR family transcriptional regulator [Streptomyces varsoviensis]|uniref:TetR/AcrR family transcriptional regulator n=1 Tax=Streptomyces varsoviensis TaxID=67373 RepID=UPI00055DE607|nr:TetR/AcrR family transcriptional regulator [Streptomyces varsoviensis]